MNKFTFYKQKSGLSYSQLAEITGVSANVLKHFGSGYRDIKKANALIVSKIAKALNCSIEDLIKDEEAIRISTKFKEEINGTATN